MARAFMKITLAPDNIKILRERFDAVVTEDGTVMIGGTVAKRGDYAIKWEDDPASIRSQSMAWSMCGDGLCAFLDPNDGTPMLKQKYFGPMNTPADEGS